MQKIDWSILRRSVNGDLTEKEKQEVKAWRNGSGENERYYQKMKNFFAREQREEVDVQGNFKRFERKVDVKRRKIFIGMLKYVAVLICLVGTVILCRKASSPGILSRRIPSSNSPAGSTTPCISARTNLPP